VAATHNLTFQACCRLLCWLQHTVAMFALYAVGAFSLVQAQALRPGDRMVVLKDEANPSAGFKVVAVVSADFVKADGYYVPAIGRGYLIADGAVAPR